VKKRTDEKEGRGGVGRGGDGGGGEIAFNASLTII